MIEGDWPLGLAGLAVPLVGAVEATGDLFEPFWLVDSAGEPVLPVGVFLADLQACGRAAATQRSSSMALLGGSGFCGPLRCRGIRRRVSRHAISSGGCKSPALAWR
jgi:hypothetical protein